MLLSFSVSNFRSFRGEQTLDLTASTRHADHPEHLHPIPNDENTVLPVAALYGANGAGKSNLIKALGLLVNLVVRGTEPKKAIARQSFRLDKTSADEPTGLSVQFIEGDIVYAYGVRVTDSVVSAEWLVLLRDEKEVPVFERATDEKGDVKIEAGPVLTEDSWGDHQKVSALTKVGVLPNQLFLHAAAKNLREQDQGPVLGGALRWFQQRIQTVQADLPFANLAGLVAGDPTFTSFAGDFLRRVSTGVDRLRVDSVEIDQTILRGMSGMLEKIAEDLEEGKAAMIAGPNGSQLVVEKGAGSKLQVRTVQSEHLTEDGDRVTLPFDEESDGTRRLTHLLPALHAIQSKPRVFIIDEIDRSLHPLLAKGFVRAFLQACAGHGSQLIFTTHDTTFLDLELLRRDEIWFADKDRRRGTTQIYSLADYKVRTDLRVDKAYLEGRFDAVPPIETEMPEWVQTIINELQPKLQIGSNAPA